jgi:hypothetical protein
LTVGHGKGKPVSLKGFEKASLWTGGGLRLGARSRDQAEKDAEP